MQKFARHSRNPLTLLSFSVDPPQMMAYEVNISNGFGTDKRFLLHKYSFITVSMFDRCSQHFNEG